MFRVIFWGVRGSVPTPGPSTVGVGGNTSCIEVRLDKDLIILDGGTGLRLLGLGLNGQESIHAHLFFSHVHWDHIQGFPFFGPALAPGNRFDLYGGGNVTRTLEETLAGQMNYPNFPVTLNAMGSEMTFHNIGEDEPITFGKGKDKVKVTAIPLNHPNGCFGYRIDYHDRAMVYATDTEHYDEPDPHLLKACRNAGLLVYDGQYTPEEYTGYPGFPSKVGWGHSTFVEGVRLAALAGVRRLAFTHHDPAHDDSAVEEEERRSRELFRESMAAREGLIIDLE